VLHVPAERIRVVGAAATRGAGPPRPRSSRRVRSARLADDTPLIVTAGRQEFQKGHVHLVEAVRAWPH
jgi:hypothetical protein